MRIGFNKNAWPTVAGVLVMSTLIGGLIYEGFQDSIHRDKEESLCEKAMKSFTEDEFLSLPTDEYGRQVFQIEDPENSDDVVCRQYYVIDEPA